MQVTVLINVCSYSKVIDTFQIPVSPSTGADNIVELSKAVQWAAVIVLENNVWNIHKLCS